MELDAVNPAVELGFRAKTEQPQFPSKLLRAFAGNRMTLARALRGRLCRKTKR